METLGVLEKKIAGLIEMIKELKAQCAALNQENVQLKEHVETLQHSLLERPQEVALTKAVVDDLIKNIDLLIEHE